MLSLMSILWVAFIVQFTLAHETWLKSVFFPYYFARFHSIGKNLAITIWRAQPVSMRK